MSNQYDEYDQPEADDEFESTEQPEEVEINLFERFPDLRPVNSAPSMFTVNGCGFGVYGARDHDDLTDTYVKTYCLCLIFIPVFALKAYRVASAGAQGWYFLGRERLSLLARYWNYTLLTSIACLIGMGLWRSHQDSPETIAKNEIAAADAEMAANNVVKAAQIYQRVAVGHTQHAVEAQQKFRALMDAPIRQLPLKDAEHVLQLAINSHFPKGVLGDPLKTGLALAEMHAEDDPKGALAILELITPLAIDPKEINAQRRTLLESQVAKNPNDVDLVSQLAGFYEQDGNTKKCEELLAPVKEKLGATEGARILGRIFADRGQLDESHALLVPYTEKRLALLHQAEEKFNRVYESASTTAFESLKRGEAPESFYNQYDVANEANKNALVQRYIDQKLKNNRQVEAARSEVMRHSSVVPAALDLGVVMLRRAQGLTDPAQREAELKKAEKTFLAVRGIAGESGQYKLFLGQVYYWLGKHDEAHQLFENLLESSGRSYETLIAVADVYREVGIPAEGRTLVEEAYNKEADNQKKLAAAMQRALMSIDLDDRIDWLKKADLSSLSVKAALDTALGRREIDKGNDAIAANHMRKSIAAYEQMPESAPTLNNGALSCFALYFLTRNRDDLDRGMKKMEKAIALLPGDSIVLDNAANQILEVGLRSVISDSINLGVLKMSGDFRLLRYLYNSEDERQQLIEKVQSDSEIAKAMGYFDKVMLLAPKRQSPYASVAARHEFVGDQAAMNQLHDRLSAAGVELTDSIQRTLDYYSGADDEKLQETMANSRKRYAEAVTRSKTKGGVTYAVALSYSLSHEITAWMMGDDVDANKIVALANEAHQIAPSLGSRIDVKSALSLRAVQTLMKEDQEFAMVVVRARRSLWPRDLLAAVLEHGGPLAEQVAANSDVKQITAALISDSQEFRNSRYPWEWAFLKTVDADAASDAAKTIAADQLGIAKRKVDLIIQPISGSNAFGRYWELNMSGDLGAASAHLRQSADQGLRLPFDIE